MENHAYQQVIGSSDAPFLNGLARRGALFTHSYAVTHPSEPNYLALFSGGTQGAAMGHRGRLPRPGRQHARPAASLTAHHSGDGVLQAPEGLDG